MFGAASNEYRTLTKQDLGSHPLAAALEKCRSPDSVLKIFETQEQAFDKFHKGGDKLMAWLTRIVHIPFRNPWRRCWSSTHPVLLRTISPTTFILLAILARKDSFYWYRVSSRGQSLPIFLMCVRVIFNSGCERCHRELRSACESLRAHSFFSSTSQSLPSNPTRARVNGVARKGHGTDSVYSRAFDQDNQGEENLATGARNLEITHRVDDKVTMIGEVF
jgi:hypothetical protein